MQEMIARLPTITGVHLSTQAISTVTSATWFPNAIAQSFMGAIHIAFYLNAGLAVVAALASLMRGRMREYEHDENLRKRAIPVPTIESCHTPGSRLETDTLNESAERLSETHDSRNIRSTQVNESGP
jgi:hypothetical protein